MKLEGKNSQELITMLANVMATLGSCGGHTKSHWNEVRSKEIREKLTEMRVEIPENRWLYDNGKFNGEGAY
jgi:hypothetical protein